MEYLSVCGTAICVSEVTEHQARANGWSGARRLWFISFFHLIGRLFGGNQALTVGPVLWLSCLHCSSGDMLTLKGGPSPRALRLAGLSTIFFLFCFFKRKGTVLQDLECELARCWERTGQPRQIKSGVNRRTSRKEKSKWGGVINSRVFERRVDWKRSLRNPTLERGRDIFFLGCRSRRWKCRTFLTFKSTSKWAGSGTLRRIVIRSHRSLRNTSAV